MPVRKFRDLDEMRRTQWMDPHDPLLPRRIAALWAFSEKIMGEVPVPRGVYKFRSIEELNAHRQEWDKKRMKAVQSRRRT
ncbi:MAG: hypothetical protein FJX76_18045 [Armatimonadetes bacterium]|nr:hypothetical protein [Armatimonadota bacterium]